MKKLFTLRFMLITLFTAMSMAMNAEIVEYRQVGGLIYDLDTETKIAKLTGYIGSATEVAIPESVIYGGITYGVTSLGGMSTELCHAAVPGTAGG